MEASGTINDWGSLYLIGSSWSLKLCREDEAGKGQAVKGHR